ncbi:MAG: isoprenylcysteine carboxylmethyltransferase family protein [Candidatus Omnitrophica bacterium]|nr:isoprenylcysteine carboxylmethyltransferase family protein [Candidatus Omnitrophota bacterium]
MPPPTFLRKARFALVYPLVIGLLLFARTTEGSWAWGIAIIALGETLRVWANGYVGHVKAGRDIAADQTIIPKGRLITAGPYAFVRHPLYLGTMLLGLGFCVMVGNAWLALIALVFFLTMYRGKMAEEEARIKDAYPAYAAYERAVPRWIPTGRRYPDRAGRWTWQGIAASNEWKTVIWVTVLVIALYFREEVFEGREWLARGKAIQQVLLLALAAALILYDIGYELVKRSR